jgi:hypothetical protein
MHHATNPEKKNSMERARYAGSPERKRLKNKEWARANSEPLNAKHVSWNKANPRKARGYWIKSEYGLSLEEWDTMLLAQSGLCAICYRHFRNKKEPFVDHNHSTGKVRGLLCQKCNTLLGNAFDSITILLSAIEYLE